MFTVELLRDMQARGDMVLDPLGRRISSAGLDWDTMPVRVEAVIEQRIGRLDDELREILTVASVEGEGFSAQLLSRVTGKPEPLVLKYLSQELEQKHKLVRARDEVMIGSERLTRYWFRHVLFQQYLYHQLTPAERRWMHLQVGNALEALCALGLDSVAVLLVRHFDQAEEPARAIPYLLRAGDRARNQYAYQEAAQHYERALQLLRASGQTELTAQTLMKLGHAYSIGFDLDRAHTAYQEGFALWKQADAQRAHPTLVSPLHPLRLLWRDPASLDPTMGGLNFTAPITIHLFSGLVAHSPDIEVIPDVAHSWDILEGGSKYVFHLRGDVFWSDGVAVTARDFEFTFKRALDPATRTPVAGLLLYGIKGARDYHLGRVSDSDSVGSSAPDDATLIFELEEPTSYFIQDLSYYVLLPIPRHIVERHGAAWAEPENIVTNGPFRLASWMRGESMLLERNPTYHGRQDGNVSQVQLTLDASIAEHFELYEQDKLDVLLNWFCSASDMEELHRRHSSEYVQRPRFHVFYLVMNVKHPAMEDARVRRAFALSLDKDLLNEVANKGYHLPASGVLFRRECQDIVRVSDCRSPHTRHGSCWLKRVIRMALGYPPWRVIPIRREPSRPHFSNGSGVKIWG